MKHRAQSFFCAIAGKNVAISLRHGGGLQEPRGVYVRCEERDCQYVDLNTPPCPLSPEMFADGSDRLVAGYVHAHAGERVCFACLTEKLSITHEQVRRASWRLKDEPGIAIRPGRCIGCQHRRVTIGLARGVTPTTTRPADTGAEANDGAPRELASDGPDVEAVARAIETRLQQRSGYAFCAHCLAREITATPAVVRDAMWRLEADQSFPIRTSQCVSCLLVKRVIRHDATAHDDDEAPRRVIDCVVQTGGAPTCAACIAFSTDLPLASVRRVLHTIGALPQFPQAEATCSVCGRWQAATSYVADALEAGGIPHDEAARLSDVGQIASGHVRYGGARIDLLSFRVRDGWRPFALVRTAAGAQVPDAPAIVLSVMPTKLEADEVAAAHARAWIEKHTR